MSLHTVDYSHYLKEVTETERVLTRLLRGRRHPVILDVGACEGEDSVRYARRFPGGRVFSFEPLPDNQALITASFARYGVTNAELVPLALSDRQGTVDFHVSDGVPEEKFSGDQWNYGNKSSSLLAPASEKPMHGWVRFPRRIPVNTERLDAFCASRGIGRVDFIHLDVQGAEFLVLTGAGKHLSQVLAIWLEVANVELYKGQTLRPQIQSFLQEHGFKHMFTQEHGDECDQFYINQRVLRGRLYLALWSAWRRLRRRD